MRRENRNLIAHNYSQYFIKHFETLSPIYIIAQYSENVFSIARNEQHNHVSHNRKYPRIFQPEGWKKSASLAQRDKNIFNKLTARSGRMEVGRLHRALIDIPASPCSRCTWGHTPANGFTCILVPAAFCFAADGQFALSAVFRRAL